MIVKRIVPNFVAADVSRARQFYSEVLGLSVVMDLGWIATFEAPSRIAPQVSFAREGSSGGAMRTCREPGGHADRTQMIHCGHRPDRTPAVRQSRADGAILGDA